MATAIGPRRRRRSRAPAVLLALSGALAAGAWQVGLSAAPGPALPVAVPVVSAAPARAADGLPRAVPVRVRIPALGTATPLVGLTLDQNGALRPPDPDDPDLAGWYAAGTSPGETGTALITGHVDTVHGPAAFFGLSTLTAGQRVEVDRADGSVARFTVDAVENHPKDGFPEQRVYGPAPRPELRLITCGGRYDRAHGGYQENTVVYAHLN
ncbi:sortase (surface protein transpeptidase) [Kitasatospora gansuensis]|uniref:Sortase (Surface protein transpeptidase) n=1 Tax=Kitasatospora gansuensis TaxID=258050 RepID=A0A7W7S7E7_9ACTN|nr:class F sortase [Kitasatospora gansuensis]MBB4944917.1 sortase (surface protein transpeptidase) [Kitasatospora gansuensis]